MLKHGWRTSRIRRRDATPHASETGLNTRRGISTVEGGSSGLHADRVEGGGLVGREGEEAAVTAALLMT